MEKISKKDRESETMAMLTGFKGALFTARNPKAAKENADKEKGTNIFIKTFMVKENSLNALPLFFSS